DLFVYFYERAVKLLNEQGAMAFISSNKYFRSGYGERLRVFLPQRTRIHELIDFDTAPVFDAIAYPSIITLSVRNQRITSDQTIAALKWKEDNSLDEVAEVVARDSFPLPQEDLHPDGWRILDGVSMRLLKRIRASGTPL